MSQFFDTINKGKVIQNILGIVGQDSTFEQLSKSMEPEELEKAMGHKYFKREGTPGNYKYYYTEAEYRAAKGKGAEGKGSSETVEKDGKRYKLQSNGKYLEVSELGMTKKEHERDRDYFSKRAASEGRINNKTSEENVRKHHTAASKLSDKEFTKEELEDKKGSDNESTYISEVNLSIESIKTKNEEEINKLKDFTKNYTEKLTQLKNSIPLIENAVSNYGAKISKLRYYKTGISSTWESGDSLMVSMSITPTEKSKIRYIKDEGFTRNGEGKNNSKLVAEAKKLEDYLKETLSLDSIGVNKYSFEEGHGRQGDIFVSLWFK